MVCVLVQWCVVGSMPLYYGIGSKFFLCKGKQGKVREGIQKLSSYEALVMGLATLHEPNDGLNYGPN